MEAPQTISEDDLRLVAQSSPAGLMLATEPDWQLPRHIDLIDSLLVQVAAGELKRVIITVPVRHGKSEMCSRFFPAWYLGMWPDKRIVVAGYGQRFADHWGEQARTLLTEHGSRFYGTSVSKSTRAKARWNIEVQKGGMFALGVGGPLTGFGANVLVIDDPHKNSEEAQSEVMRESIWDWYWGTARTRLEPGGAVVILMARWHEDDLVGRLLNHPADIEPWAVVNLPAIAEENDALGREPGEALWPARYSLTELEAIRASQLSLYWSALYQQRPAPAEGFLFKRKDFRYWRMEQRMMGSMPERMYVLEDGDDVRRIDTGHCRVFQVCDVAMSEKETADYTVVATWTLTPSGDLLLIDLQRRQFEEQQTIAFLAGCMDAYDRPPTWIERFGAGRNPLARLAQMGYSVMEIPNEAGAQVDKLTRAFGAIAMFERHRIFFPAPTAENREIMAAYESELTSFPNAANDDMVDVTSYAGRLVPLIGFDHSAPVPEAQPVAAPISAGIMSQQF